MAGTAIIAKHIVAVHPSKGVKKSVAKGFIIKSKAVTQADKIILSLNEVRKIESGKKKAKSFDQFLGEL
jgi:hypothetical protein